MSNGTVVVTGATGFLGRAVCRAVADTGRPVLAVWHHRVPDSSHPGIRWIQADLSSGNLGDMLAEDFEAVLHLAAVLPSAHASSTEAARRNRRIDEAVFDLAAERRAAVIYASGTSVYGALRDSRAADEDAVPGPVDPYPRAKLESERAGARLLRAAGGRFVALRLCAPYGPGQSSRTVMQIFIEAALNGAPLRYFGDGSREQAFTYVSDAAAAFVLALSAGDGCYNIAGAPPVTMKSLALLVAEVAGIPASRVIADGRPDPQDGLRARFATARAARELGWSPLVPLREGIARCLAARRAGAFV